MMDNHRNYRLLILVQVIVVGFGLALVLPWLANAQELAAHNKVDAQSNLPAVTRYYVAITGTGLAPTVDWNGAYTNVQDALAVATAPSEIWVAKGIYYPDVGSAQINNAITATFQITQGVALYGGFEFGDTEFSDRDWKTNLTILSGDIDGNDIHTSGVVLTASNIISDNALHVVTAHDVTGTAVLDGFTITAGNANGANLDGSGGGFLCDSVTAPPVECSPRLSNINFYGNYAGIGGGMFANAAYHTPSSASLTNVGFYGNSAYFGGGMFNFGDDAESSPELTNVVFSGNQALMDGGGLHNYSTDEGSTNPTLTNVTFSGNYAVEQGGGIYTFCKDGVSSNPDVRNSIMWNNKDSSGTGTISATIFLTGSSSISLTHSLVQNSFPEDSWIAGNYKNGGGNIDEDPLFVNPINPSDAPTIAGNLRLQDGSPAIDAGDNKLTPGVPIDKGGEQRIVDGNLDGTPLVDMGAYEYQVPYNYDRNLPLVFR